MFETDSYPYQTVTDAGGGSRFGSHATVRGRRRMGDRAFRIAKIRGNGNHTRTVYQTPRGILAALDIKRDNRAAAFLLLHRQLMLRM